jgi:hypothetical protein
MNVRREHRLYRPPPAPPRNVDDPRALHAPRPVPPERGPAEPDHAPRNWRRGVAEYEM